MNVKKVSIQQSLEDEGKKILVIGIICVKNGTTMHISVIHNNNLEVGV
jgi:hypothetical protein